LAAGVEAERKGGGGAAVVEVFTRHTVIKLPRRLKSSDGDYGGGGVAIVGANECGVASEGRACVLFGWPVGWLIGGGNFGSEIFNRAG
jgi:hypothetical protein